LSIVKFAWGEAPQPPRLICDKDQTRVRG